MIKKFKKADIMAAACNNTGEDAVLVLEHEGAWADDGKYQCQRIIFKEPATGLFWYYCLSRSGSYFTDWTYSWEWDEDEIELYTAEKVTKTIEVWE